MSRDSPAPVWKRWRDGAGVSKGTLYLYFKSKEDLFREMARARVGATVAEAEEFVRTFEGSTRELLEGLHHTDTGPR